MKTQETEKRPWQTPKITDLDVDKTKSGADPAFLESTTFFGNGS